MESPQPPSPYNVYRHIDMPLFMGFMALYPAPIFAPVSGEVHSWPNSYEGDSESGDDYYSDTD